MSKKVRFYREKAREMRALADQALDAELESKLLEVAEQYDRLAVEAERNGQ